MNVTQNPPDNEHFLRCWAQQVCGNCLNLTGCSWCPFTQTCVLNNYAIPLLAPAYDENICPHWAERWEIRTRPLGCQVSTITSLATSVSIAATLFVVLSAVWIMLRIRRLTQSRRENPLNWHRWFVGQGGSHQSGNSEVEPLLRS